MKLWYKIMKKDKIAYDVVLENDLSMTKTNFERMLNEMCDRTNLSTPVTLSSHFYSLVRFNITEYLPRDFIEPVDFTKLVIENIEEK